MASVDAEVNELKARVELATKRKMRAEADLDAAEAAKAKALKELADQFGVTSVEDAKALMLRMQQELTDSMAEVRQSLDRINL